MILVEPYRNTVCFYDVRHVIITDGCNLYQISKLAMEPTVLVHK